MIPDEMNDYERGYEDRRNENEEYISSLESQLSSKSQEIVNLERGIAGYSKEVSELQKIASDQDAELSTLRAENERLNDDNKKLISGNAELRKRCEDLEDGLKMAIRSIDKSAHLNRQDGETSAANYFYAQSKTLTNLLNQIKS